MHERIAAWSAAHRDPRTRREQVAALAALHNILFGTDVVFKAIGHLLKLVGYDEARDILLYVQSMKSLNNPPLVVAQMIAHKKLRLRKERENVATLRLLQQYQTQYEALAGVAYLHPELRDDVIELQMKIEELQCKIVPSKSRSCRRSLPPRSTPTRSRSPRPTS